MADATQQGVSTEQEDKPIDTENLTVDENNLPARLRSMESIKVQRDDDQSSQANQDSQADQQLAAQLESDSTPEPAPDGPKVLADDLDQVLVTVKIDGVERQVTVAEMQRQFQKNGAAERRLEEATRLLNEAREKSQQQASPPVGVAQDGAKTDSTSTPEGGEDGAKAFLSSLFEGDEEKAAAALQNLLGGRQQMPTLPSESELAAKLTPVIRQQLLQESALEKFAVDNPDIVQDPHLADLADGFLDAEVEAGTPYDKALDAAAKKTRDWLASKGVKPPEPTPTMTRDAKLERKAGIEKIPTLNKAASSTAEAPKSPSEVIADMRKARGLPA